MTKKNESGAALVIVLILLVTGSLLIGSLFVVAQSHINIAVREEGASKAFQNADAGVELVRANSSNLNFNQISSEKEKYLVYKNSNLEFQEDKIFIEASDLGPDESNLRFSIKAKKDNGIINFTSIGDYKLNGENFKEKIDFEIVNNIGEVNKMFNIKADSNSTEVEDLFNLTGNKNYDFDDLYTSTNDFFTWEYWTKLNNNKIIKNNGNQKLKNTTIEDSIYIVDGDLKLQNKTFIKNSIVVVKGDLSFTSTNVVDIDNVAFFIYKPEDKPLDRIKLAGNGVSSWNTEINYEKLPQIFDENSSQTNSRKIQKWKQS